MSESKNQTPITAPGGWTLVHQATKRAILKGEKLPDFRGECATIISGSPPHKPSSTGRVYVDDGNHMCEFFPSVFNLVWVQEPHHEPRINP